MSRPLPYYRYFPSDFMGSGKVQMMNATAFGIYQALLNYSWQEGPLPDDPALLWRVSKADSLEEFERYWPSVRKCWNPTPEGLVNDRLEREREHAASRSARASRAASAKASRSAPGTASGTTPRSASRTASRSAPRGAPDVPEVCHTQNSESQSSDTQILRVQSPEGDARARGGFTELTSNGVHIGRLLPAEKAYYRAADETEPEVINRRWRRYLARFSDGRVNKPGLAKWLDDGGHLDASLDDDTPQVGGGPLFPEAASA